MSNQPKTIHNTTVQRQGSGHTRIVAQQGAGKSRWGKDKAGKPAPANTPAFYSRYLTKFAPLLALLIVYLIAYSYCYDEKLYVGGDNVTYYYLGKALALGKGYVDIKSPQLEIHNIYPPGYPFILSLFMRLGISSMESARYLNGLFGFMCVGLLYLISARVTTSRTLGMTVAVFLALNGPFIGSSMVTMSEVPSLLFVMIAMYLMVTEETRRPLPGDYRFWLLLICVIAAYYIRTSAIMLLPAVLIYYAARKRWTHIAGIITGFVLAIIPWIVRTTRLGGNPYIQQFKSKNPYATELGAATMRDYLARIELNAVRYVSSELPSALLRDIFPDLDQEQKAPVAFWIGGIIILALVIYGIICMIRKQPAMVVYLVCSGALILVWPAVWFGSRFLVPLIPFIIFMLLYSVSTITARMLAKFQIGWNPLLLCFGCIFMLASLRRLHAEAKDDYPVCYQSYFDAAAWTGQNLSKKSVVVCRKPELFYYFSSEQKSVLYPFEPDANKMIAWFRKMHVTHVVVDQLGFTSTGRYLLPAIQTVPAKFKMVYQSGNPATYIFAFDPY